MRWFRRFSGVFRPFFAVRASKTLRDFWQKEAEPLRVFVSRGLAWEGVRGCERFSVGGKLAGSAPDLRKRKLTGGPRAVGYFALPAFGDYPANESALGACGSKTVTTVRKPL